MYFDAFFFSPFYVRTLIFLVFHKRKVTFCPFSLHIRNNFIHFHQIFLFSVTEENRQTDPKYYGKDWNPNRKSNDQTNIWSSTFTSQWRDQRNRETVWRVDYLLRNFITVSIFVVWRNLDLRRRNWSCLRTVVRDNLKGRSSLLRLSIQNNLNCSIDWNTSWNIQTRWSALICIDDKDKLSWWSLSEVSFNIICWAVDCDGHIVVNCITCFVFEDPDPFSSYERTRDVELSLIKLRRCLRTELTIQNLIETSHICLRCLSCWYRGCGFLCWSKWRCWSLRGW